MESCKSFSTNSSAISAAVDTANPTPAAVCDNLGMLCGYLDVFVHQARDIRNICIYHKQDVYAKLRLTGDPDAGASTRTVNGGGRNPVFNETLRLGVRAVDSSLRCEIWMLSKVKNYLEDQLLGFVLVPLADVVAANGNLSAHEFSLSSTDLFHSPAGFIQLSLSYVGASPESIAMSPAPAKLPVPEGTLGDAGSEDEMPCEYQKIEFPDLKADNENRMMVSEYFGIECSGIETQCSESITCENEEAGIRLVESFTAANSLDLNDASSSGRPVSGGSANESLVLPVPRPSPHSTQAREDEADTSRQLDGTAVQPLISVKIEPEQTVVRQDIVDMYMKSMQQFTESLANMKLPMNIDGDSSGSRNDNVSSDENKLPESKGIGPRVFYGSRAFF